MNRVKVFTDEFPDDLEININNFLKQVNCVIIGISYTSAHREGLHGTERCILAYRLTDN